MRRHFSPVKLLACDDILFTRETVNVLLAELESNQLEEIIFPDGFFWKVDVDMHHISSLWLPTCFTRTSFSNRLATFAFSISLFQWPTFDSQHSPIFLWNCTIISGDLQTPSLLRIRRSSCLTPLWKNCRNCRVDWTCYLNLVIV